MDPFKEKVGQEALERYFALEAEIASLEQKSPALLLKQKREQLEQIEEKYKAQWLLVASLEEDTWVAFARCVRFKVLLAVSKKSGTWTSSTRRTLRRESCF